MNKKSQSIPIIILAALLCLFVYGCRDQRETESGPAGSGVTPELKIGIVPEESIFSQRGRYEPLAEYLTQKMDVKIVLHSFTSYTKALEELQSRDLPAAFLGSFAGAIAIDKIGAQPLVRPQYHDGTSTYQGLIFVRKDSGIKSAQDMKDKIFVSAGMATTAGWLLPLHYFKEHNIDNLFTWLDEIYFAGTHEDTIMDVVNKNADIGAAKSTVFYTLASKNKQILNDLTILASSPPVPANTLFADQDIGPEIKMKLQETLLAMHRDKEGEKVLHALDVIKFIETSRKDFQSVFDYAKDVELNLRLNEKEKPRVNKSSDN